MIRNPVLMILQGVFFSCLLFFLILKNDRLEDSLRGLQQDLFRLKEEEAIASSHKSKAADDQILFQEAEQAGFIQPITRKKIRESLKALKQIHPFVEAQITQFEPRKESLHKKMVTYTLHLSLKSPLDRLIFEFIEDLEKQPWGAKKIEALYVDREDDPDAGNPVTSKTRAEVRLTLTTYGEEP